MKYFGTDGIRGIPNKKLTPILATKIGMALSSLECDKVVIATDTRVSKDMLGYAVASGAMSRGLNVLYAGVISTPALIYYSVNNNIIGVMITASHNPYTDNGIKIVNKGYKLNENEESIIEELIDNPNIYDGKIGSFVNINIETDYIEFISSYLPRTNLKVCIDCANGAAYKTSVKVFKKITNNLVVLSNKPDGYNINSYCGSTYLDNVRKVLIENNCDIGFAFDGDGDRVLCVDRFARVIDGDMLIYIITMNLKKHNRLKNNKIALSIMSNLGLIDSLKSNGIEVIQVDVGDKYIVKAISQYDLSLGGENSGHIILNDILHTGDGVLVASQIIKILEEEKCDIFDLLADIYMYPDMMINVKVNNKEKVLNSKVLLDKINEIKSNLNNDCKIIVRASGTEDLIRISVMAKNKEFVEEYSNELEYIVKNI